jgi:hypothetical protein
VERPAAERHGARVPGLLHLRRRRDGIPTQLVSNHFRVQPFRPSRSPRLPEAPLCDQELARFTINHTVLAQTYSPGRRVRLGPPVTPGRVLRGQPQDQRRSSGAVERPVAQPWGWVHRRVARSRCHRRIVARVTIRCNRHVGDNNWVNAANTARSAQGRCGLFTWRRNTATSWRSTSVSVFWNVELRASRPSQAMSCWKIT